MNIQFSKEKPEIYQTLHDKFGVEWENGIIITYGDTVYCKNPLRPDLVIHETIHCYQQEKDPKAWWDKYLEDPKFRLSQEVEAYKAQIKFIKDVVKDREKRFKMIHMLRVDLSGPTYGNICTYNETRELLVVK